MNEPIGFPGLGFEIDPSRVFFSLAGKDFYWYGLIIALGFLLAAVYVSKRAPKFGVRSNHLIDLLIFATPVAIICARIYYVIFEFDLYVNDPIRMLYIWEGGIAIYGGIIGGILTAVVFCKIKKVNIWAILDLAGLGFLIGQCIGRWGNFINREAYGTVTDLPWRMEIYNAAEGVRQAVHPTFLYESLWTGLGFLLLHSYSKFRKFNGEIFWLYVAWYGLGRGFIEGLRTDSLFFFSTGMRVSQVVAFGSCLIALGILAYNWFIAKHDPSELRDLTREPAITGGNTVSRDNTESATDITNDKEN